MKTIHHTPVGTVSVVGEATLLGLATHRPGRNRIDTVYLNVAGPPTAVEAIWAAAVKKRTMTARIGHRREAIRHGGFEGLGRGECAYERHQVRLPGIAYDHLILLDKRFFNPTPVEGLGDTFLFDDEDLPELVAERVLDLVRVPVFDDWRDELAAIGTTEKLLKKLMGRGEQAIYHLRLDRERWERAISRRVRDGELTWPETTPINSSTLTAKGDDR